MANPEGRRKLETILAADAVGYSRLMQDLDRMCANLRKVGLPE